MKKLLIPLAALLLAACTTTNAEMMQPGMREMCPCCQNMHQGECPHCAKMKMKGKCKCCKGMM